MELGNNLEMKYSKGTIAIHWITSILILLLFPMGKYMSNLSVENKFSLIKIHVILGFIVFLVTIIRSVIFFKHKRPKHIKTGSKLNDKLIIWIHNSFYFLLFTISLSGIVSIVNGGYIDAFKQNSIKTIKSSEMILPLKSHDFFANIMIILLILHILGVLKHYILTKENTLKRIN